MNHSNQLCLRGTDESPGTPYSKHEVIRIAIRGYLDFDSLQKSEETECFIEQDLLYRHRFRAQVKDILYCDEVENIYVVLQIKDFCFFTCIQKFEGSSSYPLEKLKQNLSKIEKNTCIEGLIELDINTYDGAPHLKYNLSGYTTPFDLAYIFQSFQIQKIMKCKWNNSLKIFVETEEIETAKTGADWLLYVQSIEPKQWFYDDELPYQPKQLPLTEADLYFSPPSNQSPQDS